MYEAWFEVMCTRAKKKKKKKKRESNNKTQSSMWLILGCIHLKNTLDKIHYANRSPTYQGQTDLE